MSEAIEAIRQQVPAECIAQRCRKKGCSVAMKGVPNAHVVVDFDCKALPAAAGKRCDYLFLAQQGTTTWVAPIELKSGKFSPGSVAEQLQDGADMADGWLPPMQRFRFVPVVAHGGGIPRERVKSLQKQTVTFRKQARRPLLIKCGAPLAPLLR